MKHMKTVLILEHEEKVFDKLTCDLCGAESNVDERWEKSDFVHGTTQLAMEEREVHPHGGHLTETAYHICPDCFKGRLMPWLAQQKAEPTVSESDW
jgi:DNA-directed RNA polymerase subunit M/transcription elongation factor TFIIS